MMMRTRAEIVEMVKSWNTTEEVAIIDAALHERHRAYGVGSGDGLLAWAVNAVADAARHYREEVHEDRLSSDRVLEHVRLGDRLRSALRGLSGPRFSTAVMWHEKIADAQETLARVLGTYAVMSD